MNEQKTVTDPFSLWADVLKKNIGSWSQGPAKAQNPDVFSAWSKLFQEASETWAKTAGSPKPFDPLDLPRQFTAVWSESWTKTMAQAPSKDFFQRAEQQFKEQMEKLSQGFSQAMGTETFAAGLAKSMQQNLAWQSKAMEANMPQLDSAMRTMNMPSRSQIDRLFQRVVGIEERLIAIEAQHRETIEALKALAAKPAPPVATPAPAPVMPRKASTRTR